jgi:NADH dehydrogenase/NADH:ubiquinone oxidoreductase subunit G
MSVTIDGHVVEIAAGDKNIVDVADRAGMRIPAACYRAGRSDGCCRGCVVDIGGEQKFACATVPEDGMAVVVDRADLNAIRNKRLLEYRERIESGGSCRCDCSGSSDRCE